MRGFSCKEATIANIYLGESNIPNILLQLVGLAERAREITDRFDVSAYEIDPIVCASSGKVGSDRRRYLGGKYPMPERHDLDDINIRMQRGDLGGEVVDGLLAAVLVFCHAAQANASPRFCKSARLPKLWFRTSGSTAWRGVGINANTKAESLLRERYQVAPDAFAELRVWRVPQPVRSS